MAIVEGPFQNIISINAGDLFHSAVARPFSGVAEPIDKFSTTTVEDPPLGAQFSYEIDGPDIAIDRAADGQGIQTGTGNISADSGINSVVSEQGSILSVQNTGFDSAKVFAFSQESNLIYIEDLTVTSKLFIVGPNRYDCRKVVLGETNGPCYVYEITSVSASRISKVWDVDIEVPESEHFVSGFGDKVYNHTINAGRDVFPTQNDGFGVSARVNIIADDQDNTVLYRGFFIAYFDQFGSKIDQDLFRSPDENTGAFIRVEGYSDVGVNLTGADWIAPSFYFSFFSTTPQTLSKTLQQFVDDNLTRTIRDDRKIMTKGDYFALGNSKLICYMYERREGSLSIPQASQVYVYELSIISGDLTKIAEGEFLDGLDRPGCSINPFEKYIAYSSQISNDSDQRTIFYSDSPHQFTLWNQFKDVRRFMDGYSQ